MNEKTFLLPALSLPIDRPSACALEAADGRMRKLGIGSPWRTHIYRRSVDARKKNAILFVYSVAVSGVFSVKEEARLSSAGFTPLNAEFPTPTEGSEMLTARPVVVGSGPAGLFCTLLLAEHGYRPLLLERGGDVDERVRAISSFRITRRLDPETNIQFGAGGAGTFSDGKLVTRVNDPLVGYVLSRFVSFGAPEEIEWTAKPHIGTDILREVVTRMISRICELGGEVRFNSRVDDLLFSSDAVRAVRLSDGAEIACGALVLAIGHSARDTYRMSRSSRSLFPSACVLSICKRILTVLSTAHRRGIPRSVTPSTISLTVPVSAVSIPSVCVPAARSSRRQVRKAALSSTA